MVKNDELIGTTPDVILQTKRRKNSYPYNVVRFRNSLYNKAVFLLHQEK